MDRKMLRSFGIAAVALAALGTGVVFLLPQSTAEAQIGPLPGTTCFRAASMSHIFRPWGLQSGPLAATAGSIGAQVGQPITTSDGRSGFTFSVVAFNSGGSVAGLGNVNMTLDSSRKPSTSTFISNSPSTATVSAKAGSGSTQRINLFINVDIDGRRYRSQGEVTLLSTAVQAFPPPPGTVYELTSNVTLLDASGRPAFVLPPGQAAKIEG